MRQKLLCIILLSEVILSASRPLCAQQVFNPFSYFPKKKVLCTHGAVVCANTLASQVGLSILRSGGNAVDAAIATQLALAVVYPGAGNLGGGGFMVASLTSGQHLAIDFREKAPGRASRDMYLDHQGNAQTNLSQMGHLACGVPGSVAGICAEFKYAILPFRKLIQPAIDLAEKGFAITASEANSLNELRSEFLKYNTVVPAFVKDRSWKPGDTLIQKDLAKTLKLIRDYGAKGFYEGETARLIVEEMQRGHGLISYEDLKNYSAKEREPTVFEYKKDYTIITMPLPSSGGVMLPQMMRMVEDQPMTSYGFESVKSVHLMTEIERYSFADRAKYLGDKDYYRVPVRTLISYPYLYNRMAQFNPDSAGNSETVTAGKIALESEETTHFDVIDSDGNAVSVTTTLNGSYGSYTVVGGAGFLLNNEMDDFSIKPGTPNMYGAVGEEANAILPGKRMLSSMTPTIVLRRGKVFLVVGTPGGTTILTSVFQTLVDIMEFGMSPEDAVNKPKFHHQWKPDVIYVEREFPAAIRQSLQKMGYHIVEREPIGRTEVIEVLPDGSYVAIGDRRGDDAAEGY
jgi:gamma-glutamyltranspeptidase/glutathione hydrolase